MAGSEEPTQATVLVLDGSIPSSAIAGLCERVGCLIDGSTVEVVVDVGDVAEPHPAVIDALARLQLTARRLGGSIRLRNVSSELRGMLTLLGLSEALRLAASDHEPAPDPFPNQAE